MCISILQLWSLCVSLSSWPVSWSPLFTVSGPVLTVEEAGEETTKEDTDWVADTTGADKADGTPALIDLEADSLDLVAEVWADVDTIDLISNDYALKSSETFHSLHVSYFVESN